MHSQEEAETMEIELLVNLFFQNLGGWLESLMQAFTFLGNELFFLLIMPALYWSIDPATGFRAGMMLIISGGLNSSLKMLFHSPRPYWIDPQVKAMASETSFGLPSGHSQNSAAIWGMIAASLRKKWAWSVALVVIFLVGISRLYLGVHFLRDVLSGWLIGGLIVILYLVLEAPVSRWLSTRPFGIQLMFSFLFSLVLIGIGLLSQTSRNSFSLPQEWVQNAVAAGAEAPNPYNLEGVITIAGVAFGFTSGYAWWRHKYGVGLLNATPIKRLARYGLGLLGIVALYFGLNLVFPQEPALMDGIFRFIRYSLIGVWVTAIAPWIFKKLHLE